MLSVFVSSLAEITQSTSYQSSNHIRYHYITLYYFYIINQTLMMDTSVIYMNQLPVNERRGEPCETSLHGSTVGYKPDPCGSVSLELCSSHLGMYSTMDTTEVNESFVTPKRQSNSQFRQMISEQVGQLLFNSPLSVCCGQIQNDTSVEENKEHDVTKRVNRKHRRHHHKRKHCRASYSTSEHVTGTCQP